AEAGADSIGIHLEVYPDPVKHLDKIAELGKGRTLVLNPDTPVEKLEGLMDYVDRILLMSVFPGFGGQKFIPETIGRIQNVSELISGRDIDLQVDGGIYVENAAEVVAAGATNLVVGTGTFRAPDMKAAIAQLKQLG
ncbi:MAG: ribulose-phosphate 3-epimerase, partial [Planctomycetes bacterium]|nr:ribulose-phosphate 3-epimerase [Planctomycetota bacterium]